MGGSVNGIEEGEPRRRVHEVEILAVCAVSHAPIRHAADERRRNTCDEVEIGIQEINPITVGNGPLITHGVASNRHDRSIGISALSRNRVGRNVQQLIGSRSIPGSDQHFCPIDVAIKRIKVGNGMP